MERESVYNVSGWTVVAPNPHEAKKILGAYWDLPWSWFSNLPAVFLGLTTSMKMNGKEIRAGK